MSGVAIANQLIFVFNLAIFGVLRIMLWGLLPFALSQVYGGTLREMGETMLPMKASVAGIITNICLNYVLIYGKLGLPFDADILNPGTKCNCSSQYS